MVDIVPVVHPDLELVMSEYVRRFTAAGSRVDGLRFGRVSNRDFGSVAAGRVDVFVRADPGSVRETFLKDSTLGVTVSTGSRADHDRLFRVAEFLNAHLSVAPLHLDDVVDVAVGSGPVAVEVPGSDVLRFYSTFDVVTVGRQVAL